MGLTRNVGGERNTATRGHDATSEHGRSIAAREHGRRSALDQRGQLFFPRKKSEVEILQWCLEEN